MKKLTLSWCTKCGRIYWVTENSNGLCAECSCNRDCEHCPYPDCIVDSETQDEIEAAEMRDRKVKKERKNET